MLSFQQYLPITLTPLVKSFWYMHVPWTASTYSENILPDGHHEIIFHMSGDTARRSTKESGWVNEPDAFFAGQTLRSYSLELKPGAILYGIRFHPHTLHTMFGFPADMLTNMILPLDEIPAAKVLTHCLADDPEKTFRNFEAALITFCKRADLSGNRYQYIQYAVDQIVQHRGDTRIEWLARKTGLSQKYFDSLFRQSVGINPKPFCNIIKLNQFINYKHNNPSKSLTECCYEAGFFDQSHLIKLFRSVTDQAPNAFFRNSNHINTWFSGIYLFIFLQFLLSAP